MLVGLGEEGMGMVEEKAETKNVKLRWPLWRGLKVLAAQKAMPLQELVEKALLAYLEKRLDGQEWDALTEALEDEKEER